MKKLLLLLLVLSLTIPAYATEVTTAPATTAPVEETTAPETTTPNLDAECAMRDPDECGENLKWAYADGKLTITGSGEMDDLVDSAPWAEYKNEIQTVVLQGVTYIGAEAFRDYDKLTSVDFGTALKEIGTRAFYSCDGLTEIYLPMSFKIFGEESLRACTNLKEIHCDGGFPSFRLNCMWESYVTIYYPANRPWPVSLIEELENAFHGRIEFIDSDGVDHFVPTEPTEETEAPTTEAPTTEAPTEAPTTVPPTEKPTEAPATIPPTEEMTEPSAEASAPTETEPLPTEPEETENEGKALKLGLAGIAVAVVLTLICAAALALRQAGKRGKYQY